MRSLLLALGSRSDVRLWRQNVGRIPLRNESGDMARVFHAGPPRGAADLSGIIRPEGWRLEVEVKAAGGTRTHEQVRWAEFIRSSGGVYLLAQLDPELTTQDNVGRVVAALDAALRGRRGSF